MLAVWRNREARLFLAGTCGWFLLLLACCWIYSERIQLPASMQRVWLVSGLLLWIGITALGGAVLRFIHVRIHNVSLAADHLMRGEYGNRFPDEGEGDLSVLGHQFNQLSRRLQLTDEQLHREQARLKQLISDVSHQFKTPLSSLLLFQELLLDPALTAEERSQIHDRSKGELYRMERLIGSLLTMSRLEAGVVELRMEQMDLKATVKEVLDAAATRAEQKAVTLVTQWDNSSALVMVHDSFWFGEALANVLNNALDFIPEGGTVTVAIQHTEVSFMLTVNDTGIGIGAEDLPFIFQRFYQGKEARRAGRGGSGIGLALTRFIVEQHGGWIQAQSELGRGTKVTMIFARDRNLTRM